MSLVTFRIKVLKPCHGLTVLVTGNCAELGNWSADAATPLQCESSSDGGSIWSTELSIEAAHIEYRFFIGCLLYKNGGHIVAVHSWESGKEPRSLVLPGRDVEGQLAVYGSYNGETCIDRGCLTGQAELHLRLVSVELIDDALPQENHRVKCIPVDLRRKELTANDNGGAVGHECLPFSPVYVSSFATGRSHLQPDDGIQFLGSDDYLTFKLQSCNVEKIALKVVIFGEKTDEPHGIGVAYLHPGTFKKPDDLPLPVVSQDHSVVGTLTANILFIESLKDFPTDFHFSACRWCPPSRSLSIGHRGMGSSYVRGVPSARVRENTLRSFSEAAKHGADMVEFDVMLTRDKIPIVFHDFLTSIGAVTADGKETSRLNLSVADLTLQQLRSLGARKCQDAAAVAPHPAGDEQLFPTLRRCLEEVDISIGFNVEVKYCMRQRISGQLEDGLQYFADRNSYIDTILYELYLHAGDRQIILSCFDPDVCSMMRAKQSRYAVVFLSQGESLRFEAFHDPRAARISLAVDFALSESLSGVAVHTEDLLKDLPLISHAHSHGLALFCWGEDNNSLETLHLMRKHMVDGIIYDRLDEFKECQDDTAQKCKASLQQTV